MKNKSKISFHLPRLPLSFNPILDDDSGSILSPQHYTPPRLSCYCCPVPDKTNDMFAEVISSSTDDSRTSETLEHDGAGSSKVQPDIQVPTSTCSNLAESQLNIKSCDAMARGISSMLGTVIRDFDCRAENTVKSQDQLSFAINRLTGELDQLLEDAPLPFIMQHASKISGVRKRVSSLNSLLKSIQRRIDNIDQLISSGLSHEKSITRNVGHQQQ